MSTFFKAVGIALLTGGLATGIAVAQGHHGHGAAPVGQAPVGQAPMPDTTSPKAGDPPSTKAFKEADIRMMTDMNAPYTGDPDVDFRLKMIPHHQGAIDMAKVALEYARDPATRTMARDIVAAQEREIGEMKAWLKAHGR